MSQLPLRSIEAFVLAARFLSLQKAAAGLGLTVPAVSRRIQLLERYLDTRLFHRLPRGLGLTQAGERYIAELGPAWDAVRTATAAVKASQHGGAFKVSVIPTFAANWLMPRLARARFAGMEVELETSPDIEELTARPDLDCAIRLGCGPWPGAVSEKVLAIEAYPVAAPGHVLGDHLDMPDDLARYTLIGSNHQPDFWPEWSRLTGIALQADGYRSFDNLQLVYEAAAAGLGIAIGLDPLVRPFLANGRLVRLLPESVTLSRSFQLVRRADRGVDRRFNTFRRWLRNETARAA